MSNRAFEPDWDEMLHQAEVRAWTILNVIYQGQIDEARASTVGLSVCQLYELGLREMRAMLSGV